ncbi:MAG: hypothetical protein QOD28_298 [Acidobacteriota bacterium]|nr:hypothetical protein [Acidobacteriota bacterium]
MSDTILQEGQRRKDGAGKPETAASARVRIRTVALPTEHGGWGLMLEPVALGLLVAPSLAGSFLAVATLGAFLARHPFKVLSGDRRRGRRFPRTVVAERFALLYACLALAGLLAATATAVSYQFILPLFLAAPFAAVQLAFDAKGQSRALAPELAGSFGLAAVSTSIALADGWPLPLAFGLWAILASRIVPTILYVRARLQLKHGETPHLSPVYLTHVCALVVVAALALLKVAPLLVVSAMLVLLLRAACGFSETAQRASAKQIGIRELAYGAMTVLAIAAGHLLAL